MKNGCQYENDLYDLKWFDYRALSPETATKKFTLEYARVWYLEILGNIKYTDVLIGLDPLHFDQWHWFSCMTKLRQFADAHFLKYDDFWGWAFEAVLKLGFQRTTPNVYLNKRILARILEKHKEWAGIRHADSIFLRAATYTGHEIQDDYCHYLLNNIKRSRKDNKVQLLMDLIESGKMSKRFLAKQAGEKS